MLPARVSDIAALTGLTGRRSQWRQWSPAGSVATLETPGAWPGAGAAAERGRLGTAKEVLELSRIYFSIGFPRIFL